MKMPSAGCFLGGYGPGNDYTKTDTTYDDWTVSDRGQDGWLFPRDRPAKLSEQGAFGMAEATFKAYTTANKRWAGHPENIGDLPAADSPPDASLQPPGTNPYKFLGETLSMPPWVEVCGCGGSAGRNNMCGNAAAAANGADPFSATAVTAIPAGGGSGATPARGAASSGFDGCHTLRVSGSKEGDASSVDGAYYFAAMHAASGFPWFCRGAVNCGDGNSGGMYVYRLGDGKWRVGSDINSASSSFWEVAAVSGEPVGHGGFRVKGSDGAFADRMRTLIECASMDMPPTLKPLSFKGVLPTPQPTLSIPRHRSPPPFDVPPSGP